MTVPLASGQAAAAEGAALKWATVLIDADPDRLAAVTHAVNKPSVEQEGGRTCRVGSQLGANLNEAVIGPHVHCGTEIEAFPIGGDHVSEVGVAVIVVSAPRVRVQEIPPPVVVAVANLGDPRTKAAWPRPDGNQRRDDCDQDDGDLTLVLLTLTPLFISCMMR